jgi:hypothetical protein
VRNLKCSVLNIMLKNPEWRDLSFDFE